MELGTPSEVKESSTPKKGAAGDGSSPSEQEDDLFSVREFRTEAGGPARRYTFAKDVGSDSPVVGVSCAARKRAVLLRQIIGGGEIPWKRDKGTCVW